MRFALRRFKYPCSAYCVTTTTSQRTVKQIARKTAITWLRFESSKPDVSFACPRWVCFLLRLMRMMPQWIMACGPPNRLNGRSIDRSTDFTRLISFSDRSGMVQDHHLLTLHNFANKASISDPKFVALLNWTLHDLIIPYPSLSVSSQISRCIHVHTMIEFWCEAEFWVSICFNFKVYNSSIVLVFS